MEAKRRTEPMKPEREFGGIGDGTQLDKLGADGSNETRAETERRARSMRPRGMDP